MGKQIRHNFLDNSFEFPIITTKQVFLKGVITELLWFLSGDTNIKTLVDEDNYIWVGDCYKKYNKTCTNNNFKKQNEDGSYSLYTREEFIDRIKKDSITSDFNQTYASIGKGYGYQWVRSNGINQIQNAIDKLLNEPDSRKIIVNAWNVADIDEMLLEPCHYAFQLFSYIATTEQRFHYALYHMGLGEHFDSEDFVFRYPLVYTIDKIDSDFNQKKLIKSRYKVVNLSSKYENLEKKLDELNIPKRLISLQWTQRSADFLLGIPFNISSYGLLLLMFAQQTNMIPYELVGNIGDCHVYKNQIDIFNEHQRNNRGFELPYYVKNKGNENNKAYFELNKAKDMFSYNLSDFKLSNYQHNGNIKYPLSN
jgi:thymidylate synthase